MKVVKIVGVIFLILGLSYGVIEYYPYIFARRVEGVVVNVQTIDLGGSVITRNAGDLPYLHSSAIAIKESSGEIVTSSAEDRQWSLVKIGQCVDAKFFPYPPWNLSKSGTYHGARLLKLMDCPK